MRWGRSCAASIRDSEQRDRRVAEGVVERELDFANRSHRQKPNSIVQRRTNLRIARENKLSSLYKIVGFPGIVNQRAQFALKRTVTDGLER